MVLKVSSRMNKQMNHGMIKGKANNRGGNCEI